MAQNKRLSTIVKQYSKKSITESKMLLAGINCIILSSQVFPPLQPGLLCFLLQEKPKKSERGVFKVFQIFQTHLKFDISRVIQMESNVQHKLLPKRKQEIKKAINLLN